MTNKNILLLSTLITLSLSVSVQAASVTPGAALDAAKPLHIEQPQTLPTISVPGDQSKVPISNNDLAFTVESFVLSGAIPGERKGLDDILSPYQGREITVGKLYELVAALNEHLHSKGYVLAKVYLPPQEIKGGKITVEILPGRYGQLLLQGDTPISEQQLKGIMSTAKQGNIIYKPTLEKQVLILSDLKGVAANATFQPGKEFGTSDLVITVERTAKHSGAVYVDNFGNRHSGRNRLGFMHHLNNIGGRGDQLTVAGLTGGPDLNNWQLSYLTPLNHQGTTLDISIGKTQYNIGSRDFAILDAYGDALTTSINIKHPLQKTMRQQTYLTLGYEYKKLRDHNIANDERKQNRSYSIGLNGTFYDSLFGGSYNSYNITQHFGNISSNMSETSGLRTLGKYAKTQFNYYRNQRINDQLAFHFELVGQLASKNLDSSEKLYISGPSGVRAYGQGEIGGDQGILARSELRWLMNPMQNPTKYYLGVFYDIGSVQYNRNNVYAGLDNRATVKGAGLGLLITHKNNLSIKLDYAWKIGNFKSEDGSNGRFWGQLIYSY